MNRKPITSHRELDIYRVSFDTAMKISGLSKKFPKEELSFSPAPQPPCSPADFRCSTNPGFAFQS